MNAPSQYQPVADNTGPGKALLVVLGMVVAFTLVVGLALLSYLRLGRDARAMRDSLFQVSSARWNKRLELNVGGFTFALARAGLSSINLPPEARAVLNSARHVEVGTYHSRARRGRRDGAELLGAVDRAMTGRGWERAVGVVQHHDVVAVYVPSAETAPDELSVSLFVLHEGELVVAAARSEVAPLLELARACR